MGSELAVGVGCAMYILPTSTNPCQSPYWSRLEDKFAKAGIDNRKPRRGPCAQGISIEKVGFLSLSLWVRHNSVLDVICEDPMIWGTVHWIGALTTILLRRGLRKRRRDLCHYGRMRTKTGGRKKHYERRFCHGRADRPVANASDAAAVLETGLKSSSTIVRARVQRGK